MKKIMFNDRFGLTDAVLEGYKTVTRRIVPNEIIECVCSTIIDGELLFECRDKDDANVFIKPTYQVCEVVAVAQRYEDIICGAMFDDWEIKELEKSAGYNNKMFVKAELMPHKIEILDVRVERLQDITDEDCIKEGIVVVGYGMTVSGERGVPIFAESIDAPIRERSKSPRKVFAKLIDKVSKKGTWDSNPYVFRYEFKLKEL